MGRVSRYKKVKSVDPFAKKCSWSSDVGDTAHIRRVKRRSKTAMKMKEQKLNKMQRRLRGLKKGGSDWRGADVGFDLPPDDEDEFDINDLIGSVKKKTVNPSSLLSLDTKSLGMTPVTSSVGQSEKLSGKIESIDLRGVQGVGKNGNEKLSTHKDIGANSKLRITAKTPTSEIIAAYSDPKNKRPSTKKSQSMIRDAVTSSKQEKRKAFMEQKKLKKRKRNSGGIDDFDGVRDSQSTIQNNSKHVNPKNSRPLATTTKTKGTIARNVIDDQVERPPIFSSLPRGASSKQKTTHSQVSQSTKSEDDDAKAERVQKEQKALEALREQATRQYALLREKRRAAISE